MPKMEMSPRAQQITGIQWTEGGLIVDDSPVEAAGWSSTVNDFFGWIQQFHNVVLIAHSGRRFDFNIFCHAVDAVNKQDTLRHHIVAFIDSLQLMRKVFPKLQKHSMGFLVQHFLQQPFNAHNAVDDTNMLVRVLQKADVTRHDYDRCVYPVDIHFFKEYNEVQVFII